MKNPISATAICLSAVVLSCAATSVAQAEEALKHYVCPACGSPCDKEIFDKPGACPKCGMSLVEQGSTPASKPNKKVGILIFDGVEIIDFAGPWEVFGSAGFDVYTVAETKVAVTTSMGMTVVPTYAFQDAPAPDIVLVPGGAVRGEQGNAAALKWVRNQSAHAEHTLSVCNGAFILGAAGLLDGLTATTTAPLIERLRAEFPKVHVVDDRRFVDNGKIITTAGLSAGIDEALHLLGVTLGETHARLVALGIEYDWRPHSEFVRAALADRLIPNLGLDDGDKWLITSYQGGTDRWEVSVQPRTDGSDAALLDHFGKALQDANWTLKKATPKRSDWSFKGRDGKPWQGTPSVDPGQPATPRHQVRLEIARAG